MESSGCPADKQVRIGDRCVGCSETSEVNCVVHAPFQDRLWSLALSVTSVCPPLFCPQHPGCISANTWIAEKSIQLVWCQYPDSIQDNTYAAPCTYSAILYILALSCWFCVHQSAVSCSILTVCCLHYSAVSG